VETVGTSTPGLTVLVHVRVEVDTFRPYPAERLCVLELPPPGRRCGDGHPTPKDPAGAPLERIDRG
jgi:hypothetical protein